MIQMLSGEIQTITTTSIALKIGPMVLEVQVPEPTYFKEGEQVTVFTHLHWNQEQGPSLYGFRDQGEKETFILILSCSGIGPKIALAILGQLGAALFVEAIQSNDTQQLCQVSGIGVKKAEQIIVHLKHKVMALIKSGAITQSSRTAHWQTVDQALQALHYSRGEITKALDYIKAKKDDNATFDQLMRYALSFLSKQS